MLAPRTEVLVSAPRCNGSCEKRGESDECSYRVAWRINPNMNVGAASPERAVVQHDTFVSQLRNLGANVKPVAFVHGAYDSVFVKDSAVVVRRRGGLHALLTQPRYRERNMEQSARRQALAAMGATVHAPPATPLEGGDVVVRAGRSGTGVTGAFLGTGFRSVAESAPALERFFGARVATLELRDPRLYHLDMALAVVAEDLVLVCEEALSPRSMARLRSMFHADALVRVSLEDALRFAVNVVALGREVVVGSDVPRVRHALRARGYRTHVVDLDQFHHAGGSAACLIARVQRDDAVTVSTTAAIRSTAA